MDRDNSPSRSVTSILVDWGLVIIVITLSLALVNVNPDSHDFSISDLSLSYAHRESPKVPFWLLIVLIVLAPVITISLVSFQTKTSSTTIKSLATLNYSLLGLGISLGSACVILNIKNLAGKPRPDFLAICQPGLTNIAAHKVGGYGQDINVMVYRTICSQPDHRRVNDAFRSFPSGYSTVAFASLCYTAMWLCQRLDLPIFSIRVSNKRKEQHYPTEEGAQALLHGDEVELSQEATRISRLPQASLPLPVYYLFVPYIPIGLAIFIAGTRYFDFRNHGIDVIAGALGGIFSAYVGMRWIITSIN